MTDGFPQNFNEGAPKVIGLTGSIGTGKSTFCDLLRGRGFRVIQTDAIGHRLLKEDGVCQREIRAAFGEAVFDESRQVSRQKLGRRVFENEEDRKILNDILHPRIRAEWMAEAELSRQGKAAACFVEIPLLFETGVEEEFDVVIAIACRDATQAARLAKGRGLDPKQILARIGSQWSQERKMQNAGLVIWNEFDLPALESQVARLIRTFGLSAA